MRFKLKNSVLLNSVGVLSTTLLLVLIIIFQSAFTIEDSNNEFKGKQYKHIDFTPPKIIGQAKPSSFCLSPQHMLNAWYAIERMDSLQGILDLSKEVMHYRKKGGLYQFREPPKLTKGIYSNAALSVIVDTKNELTMTKKPIWASYLFHRSFNDKKEIRQDDTLIQEVKSLSIYVANLSTANSATLKIQDGSIRMIAEAVDKTGQWKSIEYWSNSWCGNSYFSLVIPPRHFLLTRGIKCSGSFETTCRMMVYNNLDSFYSNEFKMSINESQFLKPLDIEDEIH